MYSDRDLCLASGHYCPQNTEFARQYPCNNGSYNNVTGSQSDAACQLCSPGSYCPQPGLEEPAGLCSGGWYCTIGSWTGQPAVLGIDSGSSCDCPAQSIGGKCVAGEFCPPGGSSALPCTPGYYCATEGLSAVTGGCQAGSYCTGSATMATPVAELFGDVCPKGNYCPFASPAPLPCVEGTFNDFFGSQDSTSCLPCTAGMFCSGVGRALPNGQCDVGWFCPEGMIAPQPAGNQCLAGHECQVGSGIQTACESGYYQPLAESGACLECPAGMYCDRNEAILEEQSGVGAPSHGVVTPKICPSGFFCPNYTKTQRENPCPIGTYSNTTSLESLAECRDCPQGYFCEAENITEPTGKCTAGYFCVLRSDTPMPVTSAIGGPCAQGTYCVEGSYTPIPCPKGTYGDRDRLQSLGDCTICPAGEFCDISSGTAPGGSCLAGFYCSGGSQKANPVSESYGAECPAGSYCLIHSGLPTLCPAGTYQPSTQMVDSSACISCDAGNFCDSPGLAAVSGDCLVGHYCLGGAITSAPINDSTGDICPAGSYCILGSPQHTFCPNGTYVDHTGASSCLDCPEGYYCVNRDRSDPCSAGYYCPANTGANLQPCPTGTYAPNPGLGRSDQCSQCDGGKYCQHPGLAAVTGPCDPGYYCKSGKTIARLTGVTFILLQIR